MIVKSQFVFGSFPSSLVLSGASAGEDNLVVSPFHSFCGHQTMDGRVGEGGRVC